LRISLLIIPMLVYIVLVNSNIVLAEDLDELVSPLIRDLEELRGNRVNVRVITQTLNEAIVLWESGDREGALRLLGDVRVEILRLKVESSRVYILYITRLILTVLILLVTPIAFYTLFPRMYLRLWFHFRKDWIVVRRSASRR